MDQAEISFLGQATRCTIPPPIPLPFWPQAQSLRYCITQWDLTGKLEGGTGVTTEEIYNRQLTRSGFFPQPDCALLNLVEVAATQLLSKIHTSHVCYVRYLVLTHFKWNSGLVRIADTICSTIKMIRHFKILQIDL